MFPIRYQIQKRSAAGARLEEVADRLAAKRRRSTTPPPTDDSPPPPAPHYDFLERLGMTEADVMAADGDETGIWGDDDTTDPSGAEDPDGNV